MNNEEKMIEVLKRLRNIKEQKMSLLDLINTSTSNESLSYADNFTDLLLVEKALNLELEALLTNNPS